MQICFRYDVIECFFLSSSVVLITILKWLLLMGAGWVFFGGKLFQFKGPSSSSEKVEQLLRNDERKKALSDVIFSENKHGVAIRTSTSLIVFVNQKLTSW